jgi:CHAT domain-containing protein
VSDEDPIQVTISPLHFRAGIAENIDVRLTNSGPGRCTNIIFNVRPQSGLMLLKGTGKIQRNALVAGESFTMSLRMSASEPGLYLLTSPSFSYQDHRGRARNVKDFTAEVIVEPGRQTAPRPRLSAELLTEEIGLDEWDLLRGSVTNVGEANALEVAVTLAGRAITIGENGPFEVSLLPPQSSQGLVFHVLAREGGTHVPVRLDLSYRGPDGQRYDSDQRHSLRVGRGRVRPPKTMKILFLGASPPGLPTLRIDQEIREIEQEIRLGRERDRIQIETKWAVRRPDISRALLDAEPDLVHFSGHGGGGEESLIVEDETGKASLVPVAGLVALFGVLGKDVRCVLVNACDTQQLAMELSAALPHAHVIGMREPVGDRSAISFSVGFYQAMAAGRPVEEAFPLGRAQMMMAYDSATAPLLWKGGAAISPQ